ncbi:hypothetical protein BJF92_07510 [Rhizobium rhizosphaerae]|uniref:Uncharacterized protein n=1 Tax=Xaviernesmea rhizosphaerae TaxID=1672749 RepID=A0A1Q9AD18_9HYPH|nr:hypothetical protein [Xaviernesmea rhizosphaerae]OLP52818.1 hypothetical protein BJF92_07510 [Xaviernesmea rhizosphaerae]
MAAATGRRETISRPFLSSRSIVFPAAFFDYSQEEIRTFILSRRTPFTIRSFCTMVKLETVDADEFGIEGVMLDYPLLHGAMITHTLIACMQRHQGLKAATLAYAQAQRDIFKVFVDDVFARYGVQPGHTTLYAVDVGWTGKSQRLLEKVLRACGYDVTLHGLYLASDAGCIEEQLAGLRAKGWLYNAGQPQRSELLGLHCKEIIEQVCSSELGAVKTYSADGDPVFGEDTKTLQQRIDLRRLRNAARRAIALYGQVSQQARDNGLAELLIDPVDYRNAYGGLVAFPTFDELTMIGRWSHDENNLSRNVEGLSSPYWETFARYATVQQFLESRSYWKVPELRRSRPALADSLVIRMMGGRHTQQEYSYPVRLGVMAEGEPAEFVDRQIFFSADGCAIVPNARICLLTSSFIFENTGNDMLRVEAVLISYYNTATRARIEKVIMPLFMDKPETAHMPSDLPPGGSFVVRAEGKQSAIYDSLFGMLSPVSVICCVRKI